MGGIPCEAGVIKACSGDVAVGEALFLTSASSCSDDNHLLIAHTLGCLQTVNPGVAELRCENLAAFGQSLRGMTNTNIPAGLSQRYVWLRNVCSVRRLSAGPSVQS